MITRIENALVYSAKDEKFYKGSITYSNGRIIENAENADEVIDAQGAYAIPGFVDVHTHGRIGKEFSWTDFEGMKELAKSYLSVGTTTLFPTLGSESYENWTAAIEMINTLKSSDKGAHFAGIHFEGRYINIAKKGAHAEEFLVRLDPDEIQELILKAGLPCHVSAAFELDTDGFAERAHSLGATLGLAHTTATYDIAVELYDKYKISFTHLFNAMPSLLHRDAGPVGAGLDKEAFCEIICDGIHLSPEIVRIAYKCLGNKHLSLITDSVSAAGHKDGKYFLAGLNIIVKDGIARTDTGALAGSSLDMKTALENFMNFCKLPLETAVRCATLTPAEQVGIDKEVGSLDIGKRADILLVSCEDQKINILKTICGGVVLKA